MQPMQAYTQVLSDFLVGVRVEMLPTSTVEYAKTFLLDYISYAASA